MPIITLGFLWKFPELWMWDKFTLNFSFHGKVLKQFCHHFWHWAREWKSKRLTNIAVETQGPASQYSQIQSNSNFMWTFLTDRQGWIHNEIQKCLFFLSRICFSSLQNLMHGRNGGNENMRNLTDKGRSIKTQVAIIDHWSRIETSGIRKPWLMHLWRYPCIAISWQGEK